MNCHCADVAPEPSACYHRYCLAWVDDIGNLPHPTRHQTTSDLLTLNVSYENWNDTVDLHANHPLCSGGKSLLPVFEE
jgi:hypothetical protein